MVKLIIFKNSVIQRFDWALEFFKLDFSNQTTFLFTQKTLGEDPRNNRINSLNTRMLRISYDRRIYYEVSRPFTNVKDFLRMCA